MASRLLSKFMGFFSSRTQVGVDKFGNRYFTRMEDIDGVMKEKRWVVFKGDQDITSIPVEWICWLNRQRKKAPTSEEMLELEARRAMVRQNVELLKKEEEEKKLASSKDSKGKNIGKGQSPDLKSFIRQFAGASSEDKVGTTTEESEKADELEIEKRSSEPTGSGESFKPGTWQPPT